MKKTLEEITADVAMLRGEILLDECDPGDLPTAGLKGLVRLEAGRCAEEAILGLERWQLTGHVALPCDQLQVDSRGVGRLPLPEDFLLLHSLKLTGWRRPVTEVKGMADEAYLRQWSGPEGVRGNLSRPEAFIEQGAKGERMLALYSCPSGSIIAEGYYQPAPRFNEAGEMEIPERAYAGMVRRLAELPIVGI